MMYKLPKVQKRLVFSHHSAQCVYDQELLCYLICCRARLGLAPIRSSLFMNVRKGTL